MISACGSSNSGSSTTSGIATRSITPNAFKLGRSSKYGYSTTFGIAIRSITPNAFKLGMTNTG
jgi:hypothetical protein